MKPAMQSQNETKDVLSPHKNINGDLLIELWKNKIRNIGRKIRTKQGTKGREKMESIDKDTSKEENTTADIDEISEKLSEIEGGREEIEKRDALVINPEWILPGMCKIMHAFGEDLAVCKLADGKIIIFEVARTYDWEQGIF